MNKKTMLIVGAVVAVIALGGLGYFLTQDDSEDQATSTSNQESNNETAQNEETEHNQQQGNLFSVAGGGKAQQCDMSYSGANGTGNGKMFTDGKGRGLMTLSLTTEKGNSGQSNTLVTSDKVYSWTATGSGQTIGFVFNKATYTANSNTGSSSSSSADPNQTFDMDCHDWTVEESKLSVPGNVTFTSLPGQ